MQVYVSSFGEKSNLVDIELQSSIDDLKNKILRNFYSHESSQDISNFRLIYGGKQLESDKILSDYNIQDKSTIQLVGCLEGGIIEPSMRVLALKVNCDNMVCRKCYARLPARAENCRKRKCGHSTNLRHKKMPRS